MPGYVTGLTVNAQVRVLNKRFVANNPPSTDTCSREFNLANNPRQWIADYSEFIRAQIASAQPKPKNILLVGVSEGALVAVRVAGILPEVTHLAIIGDGAWSMRESLRALHRRGAIPLDADEGWKEVAANPGSIDKLWFGNPYRWWNDFMDINPLSDYLALSIPIVIGFGEKDDSVPVESALSLQSKFKDLGKTNLTLIVYPGADHRLNANGIAYRPIFFGELSRHME